MKILIDAFGGDKAPQEIIKGAALALCFNRQLVLVGDAVKIKQSAQHIGISLSPFEIIDADGVFEMDEEPADIVNKRSGTSLGVALKALKEGKGDALVSAGSTGGLYVGGTLVVKRASGVKRGALATVIPGQKGPFLLIDTGANIECRPQMLCQFAKMGSIYAEDVMKIKNPRIAILSNGIEKSKGRELEQQADEMLCKTTLNYIGYIEARDVPTGGADVLVSDGFCGNIFLKTAEGVAKMITANLKDMFYKDIKTKIAALLLKNALFEFKAKFDYTEYGGAPILGISKPIIKAHGSSDANAIKNAIRQAIACIEEDVCNKISQQMTQNEW